MINWGYVSPFFQVTEEFAVILEMAKKEEGQQQQQQEAEMMTIVETPSGGGGDHSQEVKPEIIIMDLAEKAVVSSDPTTKSAEQ